MAELVESSFVSWTPSGDLDTTLAELVRYLPKLEDQLYHVYAAKSISASTLTDLAGSVPEVVHRLAKTLAILNREVGGFPHVLPAKDVLRDFDSTLNQTKVDCSALTTAKGTAGNAKLLQQRTLVCIADAARTAALNAQKFLKVPACAPPPFKALQNVTTAGFGVSEILCVPRFSRHRPLSSFL